MKYVILFFIFCTNVYADGVSGLTYTVYAAGGATPARTTTGTVLTTGITTTINYDWGSGVVMNSGRTDGVMIHITGFVLWPGAAGSGSKSEQGTGIERDRNLGAKQCRRHHGEKPEPDWRACPGGCLAGHLCALDLPEEHQTRLHYRPGHTDLGIDGFQLFLLCGCYHQQSDTGGNGVGGGNIARQQCGSSGKYIQVAGHRSLSEGCRHPGNYRSMALRYSCYPDNHHHFPAIPLL